MPAIFRRKLEKGYIDILTREGLRSANLYAQEFAELFPARGRDGLNYAADDDDIGAAAEKCAKEVKEKLPRDGSEQAIWQVLERIAKRHEINLPNKKKLGEIIARMTTPKWWRKQLRKRFQKIEAAAIRAGFVHKRAGLFVSDETLNRRQRHKRRTLHLLENMEAVNDSGQVFTLAELSALGVSNPSIRFAEMITRIRGAEEFAQLKGYAAILLTLTTPSRMHPRLSASGGANPRYDGTTPDKAQRYLCNKVWAKVMAKLKRDGIDYFGVRVVEPHHDSTPHWHMLVFVNPAHKTALIDTLRSYALREDGDEPGAQQHRFQVTHIDPTKGSAVGYIAKYLSKNIDGAGVGEDFESDDGSQTTETAKRVEAWASLWRIRQFQFFGIPNVTVWRELRRMDSVPKTLKPLVEELFEAADNGNWCEFTRLLADGGVQLTPLWQERRSASYPDERIKQVRGIIAANTTEAIPIVTRVREWQIREKFGVREDRIRWKSEMRERLFCSPWTCVNNSTIKAGSAFQGEDRPSIEPRLSTSEYGLDIGGLMMWRQVNKMPNEDEINVDTWMKSPGNVIGSFAEKPKQGCSKESYLNRRECWIPEPMRASNQAV